VKLRLDACQRCGLVFHVGDALTASFYGLPQVKARAPSICERCADGPTLIGEPEPEPRRHVPPLRSPKPRKTKTT
jgi:hypothetical protein